MKSKKVLIAALVATALATVAIFGAGLVVAQTTGDYPPIVKKLAEKFNLDIADVEKVFDEERGAHHEEMHAQCVERLDKAVEDSKLTKAQSAELQKILDKKKADHEKIEDLSPEEQREAMKAHKAELNKWAEDNDLNLKDILGHKPGHKKGWRGGGMKHGPGGMKHGPDRMQGMGNHSM